LRLPVFHEGIDAITHVCGANRPEECAKTLNHVVAHLVMHDVGVRLCNPHIEKALSHNFGTPALNFGIKVVFGDELIDPTKVHSLLALYLRQRNYASSAYFSPRS
jgi:hypothetical protein